MSKVLEGFVKEELSNDWTVYTSELEGYKYYVKEFNGKTFMMDNFSIQPFTLSIEKIEDNNVEETLTLVYDTTELGKGEYSIIDMKEFLPEDIYNEALNVYEEYLA